MCVHEIVYVYDACVNARHSFMSTYEGLPEAYTQVSKNSILAFLDQYGGLWSKWHFSPFFFLIVHFLWP